MLESPHPVTPQTEGPNDLAEIYSRRFDAHVAYRNAVWKVLTGKFFPRYISPQSTLLDLGCGYGEFINNIQCARKYAMDLNPNAQHYLAPGIDFLHQDCSHPWELPDESLDVVATSNFLEHLPSRQAIADTLLQAKRCLRSGGRFIAMGPNGKYVGGAYWDFWDHHIALTERSMVEILELQGFRVESVIDRFLPYTMVNVRAYPLFLVSLYLMFPLAWKVMGKQFLVVARKL
ncbi:MAG: class I SAM-dependent methyltransferase [Bryobacteraceae bacterium]